MSAASIAREIDEALGSLGAELGNGRFKVTLLTPANEPTNPWDPPAGEQTRTELNALLSEYGTAAFVEGTLIEMGDKKCMLTATGPRPTNKDQIEAEGVTYSVISVKDISPQGIPLYYECQLRN